MNLELISEFQIDNITSKKINILLKKCFPDTEYKKRDYFKQLPHYRILAKEKDLIIGHIGIDFRVMNLNNKSINVFGLIDLCVDPEFQKKGIGKLLIAKFESIAKDNNKIDFLFLATDKPKIYKDMGFKITNITTTWLKIDQHNNYGLGKEKITDSFFLFKSISDKQWKDGHLDLLGYMY